ncbi:heterodisulfide reductase-related iron-sulfur binding cluster [uncultured Dietzia sp.]|uniref:heterodisulfide reductase-related iron-sulfur binding cluster n=1 Tax=uncultured Dietzia sp. TaxID=395519 RepID=UPI0025D9B5E5|nr:heterodisulfide reductase-related iron-sulfur binding cluster [uncultured Dietzia sp.]
MSGVTITLGTIGVLLSLICWASFIGGVSRMVRSIMLGQKDGFNRFGPVFARLKNVIVEVAAHTRMARKRSVGFFHWFVMVGFLLGFIVWFEAYIQTFNPRGGWPWLSDQVWYHGIDEFLGLGTVIGILVLIIIRQVNQRRGLNRFTGSDRRAAYFVEAVVLLEGLGMIFVKAGKLALLRADGYDFHWSTDWVTGPLSTILPANELMVSIFALIKLLTGMIWLYVVGRNITWGVAWHRFSAFFNIYFKREADGRTALGALKPMTMDGEALTMEKIEQRTEEDEDFEPLLGAGAIEDFSWKGWLDFSTCTECGRCQEQCPAWNTGKPLSPKLMMMALRDHGAAKAPYLLAGGKTTMGEETGLVDAEGNPDEAKLAKIPEAARIEAQRPLVGSTTADVSEDPTLAGIIDPEALWSCTTCGACVEQCPVDIEHVDHFVDMRRYQVLIESEFPTELAGLFKNLENKGNPWGQNNSGRDEWMNSLDFDIPVIGSDIEDFSDTEYLFWVGCAGAFEDRAKKTTQAVATLLHTAGVKFAVLGQGETCTGDSARRAGNEFLFQMLAEQNIETMNNAFDGVPTAQRKVVVTCAHCLNALKNEYGELGGDYQVVHHTQLLNRLVRDKRLVPVAPIDGAVTYHDPCYLGRHNQVYEAPRELMDGSGVTLKEMPRHGQRSMCCGAGGARMWMEETVGKRINVDRVDEALSTTPTKIATGCPFCRVMLSDGTTAQTDGTEMEGQVEVVDVAQLLLESVTRDGGLPEPREASWIEKPKREKTSAQKEAEQAEREAAEAEKAGATATAAPAEAAPDNEVTDKGEGAEVAAAGTAGAVSAAAAGASVADSKGAPKSGGLKLGGGGKAPGGPKAPGDAKAPGGANAVGAEAQSEVKDAERTEETREAAQGEAPATTGAAKGAPKSGGLSLGGGAKAPGAPKAPGGAKAPGAPKAAAPAATTPAEADAPAPASEASATGAPAAETEPGKPAKPTVGLGLKGGAKAPGAPKAPGGAKAQGAPKAAAAPATEEPTKPEAPSEAPESAQAEPAKADAADEAPASETPAKPAAGGAIPRSKKSGGYGLSLG